MTRAPLTVEVFECDRCGLQAMGEDAQAKQRRLAGRDPCDECEGRYVSIGRFTMRQIMDPYFWQERAAQRAKPEHP